MVSPWLSMADKQKTWTGLPLIGQGTDINVSSVHMVGYLGKVAENPSPNVDESCPICAAKGRKQHLRTFCISWKESILLCENPQCIFPLGSKPLNEILISSVRSPVACGLKRQKISNSVDNRDTWSGFNVTTKKSPPVSLDRNSSSTDICIEKENNLQFRVVDSQNNHGIFDPEKPNLVVPGQFSGKKKELPTKTEIFAETRSEVPAKGSSTESFHLQWKNKSALCWLDCVLTALVHLKSIRKAIRNLGTEVESPVKRLCMEYDRACGLLSYSKGGKDNGIRRVSAKMMCQVEYILNEIRESIFLLLQPTLKCELGKHDSPVFALPLLLKADPYIEELFMTSYTYSFECDKCGYKNVERHAKTLPTVTNLLPDWHPLNAVLVSPCNKCQDVSQRRKMLLNQLPSIFMLHFVDGLPHADLDSYGFCFEGISYKICAVIQYIQSERHFVSWIQNSDESWLECDDLKGSNCSRKAVINVPAHEIHIAMWAKNKYGNTTGNQEPVDQPLATETTKPNSNCVTEITESGTKRKLLSGLEPLENDTLVTLNLIKVEVDSEGKSVTLAANDQQSNLLTQQNNASSQDSSENHNESVQLCFKHPNEIFLQDVHTTAAKPDGFDVHQSHILHSEAASCSLSTPQIQVPDAGRSPVSTGRCSKLKGAKLKPAASNVIQEQLMQISSEMPVLSPCKETKAGCGMSPPSNQTLKKTAAPGASLPGTTKRLFGTSWSKNLMDRQISSIASSTSKTMYKDCVTSSLRGPVSLKVTDSNRTIKEHFDGFKTKGLAKCAGKANKIASKDFSNVQNTCNHLKDFGGIKENNKELLPMKISSVYTLNKIHQPSVPPSKHVQPTVYQKEGSNIELRASMSGKKEMLNTDTKTQKLRLKLLKKLQVKKDRLAALDQQMKTEHWAENVSSSKGKMSNVPNNTESKMFHDVLNDLWHQLGVEDSDSICTSSSSASNASISSSPSNDDILAEFFNSPTSTASTYDDEFGSNDFSTGIEEVKLPEVINRCLPAKENIMVDLLSTPTLSSLTGGPEEELLHFDVKLFENC